MEQPFPNELKHLYKEAEFIGSGGFARVFRAKHRDGRIVTVKIPPKVVCNWNDSYNCFGGIVYYLWRILWRMFSSGENHGRL